ncbi:hypothetical protein G6F56_014330 [Rhizopus delemar]|nr:hypothetical protein G6F65_022696 [Rhizopus arrhizus]KAG1434393.1 hypothetical protein G6F56_014330 [Rhizopus delemar]
MHDGGGGVAGTEVDAEAHGEFRGRSGAAHSAAVRHQLQVPASCREGGLPPPLPAEWEKGRPVTMAAVDSF